MRGPATRRLPTAAALALIVLTLAPEASAYGRPTTMDWISRGPGEDGPDGPSGFGWPGGTNWSGPSMSADGTVVAFPSLAANLVPGDTNEAADIFVRDRISGSVERVSVASDGAQADAMSTAPAISGNGRWIAFESDASNLAPGGETDPGVFAERIYLHDRTTGETRFVGTGFRPALDGEGRTVVYDTLSRIYAYDRVSRTTEIVSVASDGTPNNAGAQQASISADGRIVAFASSSSNLDRDDPNITGDIFAHDRLTGRTDVVSISTEGVLANAPSQLPTVSGDGRFVSFWSYARNLVPNQITDLQIFVHDRYRETTELVSVGTFGTSNDWWAWNRAAISHDGRYVAFRGGGDTLVPNDTHGGWDLFVRDRLTDTTEILTTYEDGSLSGAESSHGTGPPAISADGRFVAFDTAADLGSGDSNGFPDVYVRDRGPHIGIGTASRAGSQVSGWASLGPVVLISAPDAHSDAGIGRGLGGDVHRVTLQYRPEVGDLLLRLDVSDIPGVRGGDVSLVRHPGASGAHGLIYGLSMTVDGVAYQARGAGSAEYLSAPTRAFALYRCTPDCARIGQLEGAIGTSGNVVHLSVPLPTLGAREGTTLQGLRVFTALGDLELGSLDDLDEVALGVTTIPAASVTLGVGPSGGGQEEAIFDTPATLVNGAFSGQVMISAGERAWARACVGAICRATPVA